MYRRQIGIILGLLVLIIMIGCPKNGTQTLTPKQHATVWMQIYNSTYDDTLMVMQNPSATPAQKEIALQKKAILAEMWPMLKVYVATVEGGATPSAELEATLAGLVNRLTALTIGGR